MKKLVVLLFLVLTTLYMSGQDITGQWNGILKVQEMQLRIVFHITETDTGLVSTMDSPDQGARGIPVSFISFENNVLILRVAMAGIEYEGTLNNEGIIEGNFKQGGQTIPLNLSSEEPEVNRPQEPKGPLPYISEDIKFENTTDNITLAGTLTLPGNQGNFPAVILISGSGAQNRNEEVSGHKPFLVISDYLTRQGIAVLRYDDRGTAESEGDYGAATSADLANDVRAAIAYLKTRKEIDQKKIGLVGHSEGGIIAPMVAAKSKEVGFIILLAGSGIPGGQLLLMQIELINRASGISEEELLAGKKVNKVIFDIITKATDKEKLQTELTNYLRETIKDNPEMPIPEGMSEDDIINNQIIHLTSTWMLYFIKHDPAPVLEKVTCPVLALNGEKDLQVPPEINLKKIKEALEKGGNKNVTVKELPGLNHLFQECETGSPMEYSSIEQTFSPIALKEISDWIVEHTN